MAVRKDFTTKSGLTLPLMNLKGKEYLLIADRIRWFVTENEKFEIDTNFLTLTDDKAVAKTTVTVFNQDGSVKTRVNGIKSEDRKDFADFAEKATTGSLGRAVTYLGYGTQFSADELNELVNENGKEVNRLADAPISPSLKNSNIDLEHQSKINALTKIADGTDTKTINRILEQAQHLPTSEPTTLAPLKRSSFNKNKKTETPTPKAIPATIGEQPGETEWN